MITRLLLVLGVCLTSTTIQATIVTYSDLSSFNTAVSSSTTIDFEAQNTNGSHTYYANSLTVGDVTFTQPNNRLFVFNENFYPTHGLTSNYLNQNCCAPGGITISFADPTFALGFDLGVQNNWSNSSNPNDFQLTLSTGDILNTTAPLLYNNNNTLDFFGFTSTVAFTSLTILNPAEGISIDNLVYSSSPTNVPEPLSLALLLLGLSGFGVFRRR